MVPHSSTFAWKIPWTEEPGRLQSMGSLESDMTELLHFDFSLLCIGEGNGSPLQCSCLENPRDGGAWWADIYGVAQSRTGLKRLSSSSSRFSRLLSLRPRPGTCAIVLKGTDQCLVTLLEFDTQTDLDSRLFLWSSICPHEFHLPMGSSLSIFLFTLHLDFSLPIACLSGLG